MGYPAERVSGGQPYRGENTLVIKGQVTSIDQVSTAPQVEVGLGAGHSDVKTYTQLYDFQRCSLGLLNQFTTDARSGTSPARPRPNGLPSRLRNGSTPSFKIEAGGQPYLRSNPRQLLNEKEVL
jgi:hypothetical protein